MLVLAAVPDLQFHKLRRTAGGRFSVVQTTTWDDVLTVIRGRPVELAVVDPLLSGDARSQEIERLRVLFPSLPLILYTTLTPRTAGVLYAHRLLQDPGFTIEDVAKRLGYAQTKTLQLHARAYLGLTAGEMRLSLSPDEALARVVQGFLTPAGARASVS